MLWFRDSGGGVFSGWAVRAGYSGGLEATIEIGGVAFGGAGVGRLTDGRACFVPGTLPGERAVVRVVRSKKSYAEAEVVRLAEVSPRRVRPVCPVYGTCGGCAYQHAEYPLQLELKTAQVADLLRRVGGLTGIDVRGAMASPLHWGYRNRLSVHVEDGRVGFHHRKSHRIVEVAHCPLASEAVNARLAELATAPPRGSQRVTLREDRTGARGFSQVNDGAADVLMEVVRGMAGAGGAHLVDAYCGAGFFAKGLRGRFAAVTGIEWSEGAVRSARAEALENETYLAGAVEIHFAAALGKAPSAGTTLVLDPPAEGLSADAMQVILDSCPAKIIYVSCDPATLARDLKKLTTICRLDHVQPVDMFPQTAEIESVALLTKS